MRNRYFIILGIIINVACIFTTIAMAETKGNEKPIIIKGLSIGMDINEAKDKIDRLLPENWKASPIGNSVDLLQDYRPGFGGDEDIFGNGNSVPFKRPIIDKKGILIKNRWGYHGGFISADKNSNKVTRITFSGRLTDDIYSTKEMNADDFVEQFQTAYGLPPLNWIPRGWTYTSKNGYTVTIMTDKFLDLKKDDTNESGKSISKPIINFSE